MEKFLENLWRWKCGLPELRVSNNISIEELKLSEWSKLFEKLMRNRLIFGAFRYGKIHDKNKPNWDRVDSIFKRTKLYQETGNREFLVDIANLALLEFEEGSHPKSHFKSNDDTNIHVTIKD